MDRNDVKKKLTQSAGHITQAAERLIPLTTVFDDAISDSYEDDNKTRGGEMYNNRIFLDDIISVLSSVKDSIESFNRNY